MDISELIKEAKKGSAGCTKILFDMVSEKMMLLCRRYVKTYEDAEEILLDGFYKFF
jgi:RNA polymerase sigma-70 factor (ECF subfamily)